MDIKDQKKGSSEKLEIIYWNKMRQGDTAALGQLYDRFVDILFAHGMRKDGSKDYVMDCIHDLFFDLYKYRAKLSFTDNVEYYLIKSLNRKINRQYKRKDFPIEIDGNIFKQSLVKNHTESFEEDIIREEGMAERTINLQEALDTLTPKQKKGLYLRFDQERTYEEIADIMDISIETARTTIYRAIKALRKHPFLLGVFIKIIFF
ncbi:sigma-70 family RNA polymerase sigma factor [Arenibacter sp. BSSL-BM3]|uniref:Sigma-70 family RNA polymerase sigma factor n=1 Tax=Arenibacter arenosicollis TaxID=2762274 RepID=A0ABR7QLB3_9FLAO|nr:sigma-70 family RNA polymerase sigma factor [Arenibacter arenosicollis]MBC8767978.1 sigma-70 family RNA polymerase sigma factor [Arenibacter arenosicollis]